VKRRSVDRLETQIVRVETSRGFASFSMSRAAAGKCAGRIDAHPEVEQGKQQTATLRDGLAGAPHSGCSEAGGRISFHGPFSTASTKKLPSSIIDHPQIDEISLFVHSRF